MCLGKQAGCCFTRRSVQEGASQWQNPGLYTHNTNLLSLPQQATPCSYSKPSCCPCISLPSPPGCSCCQFQPDFTGTKVLSEGLNEHATACTARPPPPKTSLELPPCLSRVSFAGLDLIRAAEAKESPRVAKPHQVLDLNDDRNDSLLHRQ